MHRVLVLLSLSQVLASCAVGLTAKARDLTLARSTDIAGCEQLGAPIEASRGQRFARDQSPAGAALVDVKNEAAERGADHVLLLDVERDHGLLARAFTLSGDKPPALLREERSATAYGIAYRCGTAQERRARLQSELKRAPTGADGFSYGASADDAKAACERGGRSWLETDPPRCAGKEGFTRFELDASGIASIELVAPSDVSTERDWEHRIEDALVTLTFKHGPPTETIELAPACAGAWLRCTRNGQISVLHAWRWPSGTSVFLRVETVGNTPAVVVRYQRGK